MSIAHEDVPRGAVARQLASLDNPAPGMWTILATYPGAELGQLNRPPSATVDHRPTILWKVLDADRRSCYRGACLGCTWESDDHDTKNAAVESAHDHAFPGWRELPAVLPAPKAAAYNEDTWDRWFAKVAPAYPAGWFDQGGPIVVLRSEATRHRPRQAPGGGFELVRLAPPRPRPAPVVQDALFA